VVDWFERLNRIRCDTPGIHATSYSVCRSLHRHGSRDFGTMPNSTVREQLLQDVQDRTIEMCRWLDTDNNSEALMAHLHDEPVDESWLSTYQRLNRELMSAVGNVQEYSPRRR
jgi:hypothetical protein